MEKFKEVLKIKEFSKFVEILKNFTELEFSLENGEIVAKGETRKFKEVLKACFFLWNNRKENWIFYPYQFNRNPLSEKYLKQLKKEYGVS